MGEFLLSAERGSFAPWKRLLLWLSSALGTLGTAAAGRAVPAIARGMGSGLGNVRGV